MSPAQQLHVISPALLDGIRQDPSLPAGSWYLIAAAALCAINRPAEVAGLFDYALDGETDLDKRTAIARKYREALIKAAAVCGLPKTILSLLALKKVTPGELLDKGDKASQRTMDFTETPAQVVLQRGQAFFDQVYGAKSQSMMRVLGSCGTPDLAAAARLMYAFFLSNTEVLSAKEAMLVIVAAGAANQTRDTTLNHMRGAINFGATAAEVDGVCEVVRLICEASMSQRDSGAAKL